MRHWTPVCKVCVGSSCSPQPVWSGPYSSLISSALLGSSSRNIKKLCSCWLLRHHTFFIFHYSCPSLHSLDDGIHPHEFSLYLCWWLQYLCLPLFSSELSSYYHKYNYLLSSLTLRQHLKLCMSEIELLMFSLWSDNVCPILPVLILIITLSSTQLLNLNSSLMNHLILSLSLLNMSWICCLISTSSSTSGLGTPKLSLC